MKDYNAILNALMGCSQGNDKNIKTKESMLINMCSDITTVAALLQLNNQKICVEVLRQQQRNNSNNKKNIMKKINFD